MKKFILPIVLFFMLTGTVFAASNLEISTTSDFSILSTNFTGGETVFVRIASTSTGSIKSVLNLRDNNYNLVNSFKLAKEGNYFSAVIPSPYSAGYYSLEAQIESNGSATTSVKTIKVGSPASANVVVNVNSQTGGENVLGQRNTQEGGDTQATEAPSVFPTPQLSDGGSDAGVLGHLTKFFKEVVDFLWPF